MDDVPVSSMPSVLRRPRSITNIGGGLMAMTYAAAHPERVSSLILVDCFAAASAAPDYPIGAPPEEARALPREQAEAATVGGIR